MDLFTAFNVEKPEIVKKEEKKQEKKAKGSKSGDASSQKKTEQKKPTLIVNDETVIRYAGQSYPISLYFNDEEIEEGVLTTVKKTIKKEEVEVEEYVKITEEMIRERMENGRFESDCSEVLHHAEPFPELVKDLTTMHYDKEKNMVIPVMAARKKGMGAPSPSLPKIPFNIIMEFWKVARHYALQEVEIHADIYWNPGKATYVMDIPNQEVSPVYAEVTTTNPMLLAEMKKIMEIHSHHKMLPLPSDQDNESERYPNVLYAIVGGFKEEDTGNQITDIGALYPILTMRYFEKGKHYPVKPWSFIEHPFPLMRDLPQVEVMSYV